MTVGKCAQCGAPHVARVTIRIIEQMSGPGASAQACAPCARREASKPGAPEWLRANVAALEAAQ